MSDTSCGRRVTLVRDHVAPVHEERELVVEDVHTNGLRVVTLNRPRSLNALSLGMIQTLARFLREWELDPCVGAVVVKGIGTRAFCAGGDIRSMHAKLTAGQKDYPEMFFRYEYSLNRLIHRLAKPYMALLDGITMGGGAGISVHGSYRVATERTIFAMPETAIGLFPDIGATRFLSTVPGHVGMYLALTGARLRGADLLWTGLATHYVPSKRLPRLMEEITHAERVDHRTLNAALSLVSDDPGPSDLASHANDIDRCFSASSIEEILSRLKAEGTPWAEDTTQTLLRHSPTSLKVTFRQMREGKDLSLEDALRMEFRIGVHMAAAHDFTEGVRAVIVDKDGKPQWKPATVEDVSSLHVDRIFAPVPRELGFL